MNEEKTVVEKTGTPENSTIKYSDGSTLTRVRQQHGWAGLEDDIWVETLSNNDGSTVTTTYTTTGSKTIIDFSGNANDVRPIKTEKVYSNGSKEISTYSSSANGSTVTTTEFYEPSGTKTGSMKSYESGGYTKYNAEGKKVESLTVFKDGDKRVYQYDANEKPSIVTQYDSDGDVSWSERFEYDSSGREISEKRYGSSGNLTSTTLTDYNENGGYKETTYDSRGEVYKTCIKEKLGDHHYVKKTYNANGDLIAEDFSGTIKAGDVDYREYYPDGTIKEEHICGSNGATAAIRKYDTKGNLISNQVANEITIGGKVYTFNATELMMVISLLDTSKANLSNILGSISSECNDISGTVASADSGLAGTMSKLASLCDQCSNLISRLLDNLSSDINAYIDKTVANEEANAQALAEIDNSLGDIANEFDAIGQ